MSSARDKIFPPYSRRRAFAADVFRYFARLREWFQVVQQAGVIRATQMLLNMRRQNIQNEATYATRRFSSATSRPLRILTYHWHTSYQYELFKLPHVFTLVRGVGLPFNDRWNYEIRPMPGNACFVAAQNLRLEDYDLAILPFDETVLAPELTHGARPYGWGDCFNWLSQQNLPKMALCHATAPFYGQYTMDCGGQNCMEVMDGERQRIVDAIGQIPVVCQSRQSLREWGFARPHLIWHGFDPEEFLLRRKDASGILTLGQMALRGQPYYNGFFLAKNTKALLPANLQPLGIATPKPERRLQNDNDYAWEKYRNYREVLRRHVVYLNPTLRSPMPFTRTEAMLCGLVPVTTGNNDAADFIRTGVNGFVGDTAEELAEYCLYCMRHPDVALEMGRKARRTAVDVFNTRRFLAEWQSLMNGLI